MNINTNSITAIDARAIAYPARLARTEAFIKEALDRISHHIRDAAAEGAFILWIVLGEDGCPKYEVTRVRGVDYTIAASEIDRQLIALGFDISRRAEEDLQISWA